MYDARLEGGPFDGAAEEAIDGLPPGEVVAWMCPECRNIHIDREGPKGSERYLFDHHDGPTAVFVYGDLNLSPDGSIWKDLVNA